MLESVLDGINVMSGDNPMIAGAISLWALGIVTYFCRHVPIKIYNFLKKHLTTELTISSQHSVFHNLLNWLEDNGYSTKFRKIKLSNGRWGYSKTTKSVGYGSHLIFYNKCPIIIDLIKEQNSVSDVDKDRIYLTKLGRSHKVFNKLIYDVEKKDDKKCSTKIYKYDKAWNYLGLQPKRNLDTIIIDSVKKDSLIETINNFYDSEDWYIKHGIPYQLGILLYGPPGTGKTSLIKGLAAYKNKSLCMSKLKDLHSLEDMLQTCPKDSIIVLEDIDRSFVLQAKNKKEGEDEKLEEIIEGVMGNCFSDILNAIDGVICNHGRILVMTTNHIEKIDTALLRPGRVDFKLEVGYVNNKTFVQFLNNFFPKNTLKEVVLKNDKLTGAELQNDIQQGLSCEKIKEKHLIKD